MKISLLTLTTLCLFTTLSLRAQKSKSFKEHVLTVINASVQNNYSPASVWTSCNRNDSFLTTDTIRMINSKNVQDGKSCCSYINWKFASNSVITFNYSYPCTEPPGESISLDNSNLYSVKYKYKNEILMMEFFQDEDLRFRYKVIAVESVILANNESAYQLVLVRI